MATSASALNVGRPMLAWVILSAALTSACPSRGVEAQEQPTDRTASQQLQVTYAPPRQQFIQGSVSF